MIELGGNIKLENFENIDPIKMIVIKKVTGNYAKKISEKAQFQELKVKLTPDQEFQIEVVLTRDNKETKAEHKDKNLFYALDNALNKILQS